VLQDAEVTGATRDQSKYSLNQIPPWKAHWVLTCANKHRRDLHIGLSEDEPSQL
jgi:hypothetical protein